MLLRPPITDAVTSDALARVRGELTAAGFERAAMLRRGDPGRWPTVDARALETVGRELDPIAAFAIVRAATGNTAEIWVCDRIAGKSVIQSVRLDAGWNAGRVVAVGRAGGAGRRAAEGQPRAILAGVAATGVPAAGGDRHRRRRRRPTGHLRDGRGSASRRPSACSTTSAPSARCGSRSCASPTAARAAGRAASRVAGLGTDAELRDPDGSAQSSRRSACSSSCAAFAPGRGCSRSSPSVPAPIASRVVGAGGGPNFDGSSRDAWSALGVAGGGRRRAGGVAHRLRRRRAGRADLAPTT